MEDESIAGAISQLDSTLSECFKHAQLCDFPAFPKGVPASTPINAAPFVTSLHELGKRSWDTRRQELIETLNRCIASLTAAGMSVPFLIVGGSFLNSRVAPKDIDCVAFYTCEHAPYMDLEEIQAIWRKSHIDIRLLPLDIEPLIVLKTAMYFGLLYSCVKDNSHTHRGCVLVRC